MPLFLTWKVIFSVQNQENQQIKEPSADKIIEGLNQENQQSSEPSADEIIEVLKNLEQLAAKNPALYRAITDQIKLNVWKTSNPGFIEGFFDFVSNYKTNLNN